MAFNISEWAAAGLDALHVSARNTAGALNGFLKLDAADTDTGSGMRRLKGAVTAPIAIPEPNRVPVRGDNRRITTFQFTSDADNSFTIEMGITDIVAEGFFQGSTLLTVGDWDFGLRGAGGPTFADAMFLLTRDAESQESGSVGASGFENLLVLNSNVLPIGDDQFSDSEAGGSRYSVTANPAEVLPWGQDVGEAVTLNDGLYLSWASEYRCMFHAWVADGTETDIVLDYTPVTAAKTKAWNAVSGAALTVSSINAGTKTLTLSAAPASGVLVVVLYECASF